MLTRIARPLTQMRWLALAVALVLGAACLPALFGAGGAFGAGELGGQNGPALTIIAVSPSTQASVAKVAFDVTASDLESEHETIAHVSRHLGRRSGLPSTTFGLELMDNSPGGRRDALHEIPDTIDPGPLTIKVAGAEASAIVVRHHLGGDLWRWELIGLPAMVLAAVWLLGFRPALWSALAALLGAVISIAIFRLVGSGASVIGLAVAAPLAVVIAIHGLAALGYRYGELPDGVGVADRIESMLGSGMGDGAVFAGAAGIGAAALGFLDFPQAGALVLGALSAIVAGSVAAVLLALAAREGCVPRIFRRRPRAPQRWHRPARLRILPRLRRPRPRLRVRRPNLRLPAPRLRAAGATIVRAGVLLVLLAGPVVLAGLLADQLADLFDSDAGPVSLGDAAAYSALGVAVPLILGRAALLGRYLLEERALSGSIENALRRVRSVSFGATGTATLVLVIGGGVMLSNPVRGAREFGALIGVLALADLLLTRTLGLRLAAANLSPRSRSLPER